MKNIFKLIVVLVLGTPQLWAATSNIVEKTNALEKLQAQNDEEKKDGARMLSDLVVVHHHRDLLANDSHSVDQIISETATETNPETRNYLLNTLSALRNEKPSQF
jgi:hypothetical protein